MGGRPGGWALAVASAGAEPAGGAEESTGADALGVEGTSGVAGAAGGADAHEAMRRRKGIRIAHLPWKCGLRFSAKAASASRRSSLTIVRS